MVIQKCHHLPLWYMFSQNPCKCTLFSSGSFSENPNSRPESADTADHRRHIVIADKYCRRLFLQFPQFHDPFVTGLICEITWYQIVLPDRIPIILQHTEIFPQAFPGCQLMLRPFDNGDPMMSGLDQMLHDDSFPSPHP